MLLLIKKQDPLKYFKSKYIKGYVFSRTKLGLLVIIIIKGILCNLQPHQNITIYNYQLEFQHIIIF